MYNVKGGCRCNPRTAVQMPALSLQCTMYNVQCTMYMLDPDYECTEFNRSFLKSDIVHHSRDQFKSNWNKRSSLSSLSWDSGIVALVNLLLICRQN